jgi:hypothetical protein
MAWWKAISEQWSHFYDSLKREFLRDPDVVLFNMGPDEIERAREEKFGLR